MVRVSAWFAILRASPFAWEETLHEKGGKEHEAPAITSWKPCSMRIWRPPALRAMGNGLYSGPRGGRAGWRSAWGSRTLTAFQRRARQAGIETKIGNHSLRATGITDYLKNSGTLEHAQQMASDHSETNANRLKELYGLGDAT